jgi:ATP-dependent helicase HrpA
MGVIPVSGQLEATTNEHGDVRPKLKAFPQQAHIESDGSITHIDPHEEYILGSPEYPVAVYRDLIVETVAENSLTIITAKTGTGKSTNVAQYLFESGKYEQVVVTQPRVLAARELKNHVASDMADSLGEREHEYVGFQTAVEGDSSKNNVILYVTDGLQLMREIMNQGIQEDGVLLIDEFHERSSNMDALFAIAIHLNIRLVVMSATLDAQKISDHYSEILGHDVPIIDIPGVTHEVIESYSDDFDGVISRFAKADKNIQAFLPGRKEISSGMSRVGRRVSKKYTLLALHGDQTPDQQRRVMVVYENGKIIFSTSVGQTSITIPDSDVVVDSGYERTMGIDEFGVNTLFTQPSSGATSDQRRGRVGRTKPGVYVRAQLKDYPSLPSLDDRQSYDIPEIQRMRLDELQLKLAAFGHSILSLPFYDVPSETEIDRSNERLVRLQFFRRSLADTALMGYELTELGERAAKLPLDAHSARMLLESRKYGPAVELQMMAAVAVRQINGITSTVGGMENWRKLTTDKDSDIIAGIDYMFGALQRNDVEQNSAHIIKLRYDKAVRAFEQLAKRRSLDMYTLTSPTPEQREQLLRSIATGVDEIFTRSGKSYVDIRGKRRIPVKSTIVDRDALILAGEPFNLQQVRKKQIATHSLIVGATAMTTQMLEEAVPHRVSRSTDKLYIDDQGIPRTVEVFHFDGKPTRHRIDEAARPSAELQRFILESIFSTKQLDGSHGPNIKEVRRLLAEMRRLQHRTKEDLGIGYSIKNIIDSMMHELNYKSTTFDDVDPFLDVQAVHDIVPTEIRQEIMANAPGSVTIVDNGKSMRYHVNYYDNYARITIPPYYYHLLPFVIGGGHRVRVRPSENITHYVALEDARDAYEEKSAEPNRETRRGNTGTSSAALPVRPRLKDQRGRNIKPRKR